MDMPGGIPEDLLALARAEAERRADREIAVRRQVLAYAWLLCSCAPWYDRASPGPPQGGCIVHGNVLVTLEGEVL